MKASAGASPKAKGAVSTRGQQVERPEQVRLALLRWIVDEADASCPECDGPLLVTWRYCPSCGVEIVWPTE
jgi:hypothetical protein